MIYALFASTDARQNIKQILQKRRKRASARTARILKHIQHKRAREEENRIAAGPDLADLPLPSFLPRAGISANVHNAPASTSLRCGKCE